MSATEVLTREAHQGQSSSTSTSTGSGSGLCDHTIDSAQLRRLRGEGSSNNTYTDDVCSGEKQTTATKSGGGGKGLKTLSLHDPDFKHLITVPLSAVHHLPPAHLEISRLVLCRKYDPREPDTSCPMGESCKFVHLDLSTPELQVQSIHVNYAYRNLDQVPHDRLPGGETLHVLAPNNKQPRQSIASEMVLATRGALGRHTTKGPLSHCAHYYFNRSCNRGERCSFIHAVYLDENASEHQRAPPRAAGGTKNRSNKKVDTPTQDVNGSPQDPEKLVPQPAFSMKSGGTNTTTPIPVMSTFQPQVKNSPVQQQQSPVPMMPMSPTPPGLMQPQPMMMAPMMMAGPTPFQGGWVPAMMPGQAGPAGFAPAPRMMQPMMPVYQQQPQQPGMYHPHAGMPGFAPAGMMPTGASPQGGYVSMMQPMMGMPQQQQQPPQLQYQT